MHRRTWLLTVCADTGRYRLLARIRSPRLGIGVALASECTLDGGGAASLALELVASSRDILVRQQSKGTADVTESWDLNAAKELVRIRAIQMPGLNSLLERTSEVKSTANSLELGEAVDGVESGVVRNLESTADSGQLRQRNVTQLVVADESKGATDTGQVWRGHVLEGVSVEAERAVDGGQSWHRHGGHTTVLMSF